MSEPTRLEVVMWRMPTRERLAEIIARAIASWPDGRDPWLDDEYDEPVVHPAAEDRPCVSSSATPLARSSTPAGTAC
jgi:hypothetical protein